MIHLTLKLLLLLFHSLFINFIIHFHFILYYYFSSQLRSSLVNVVLIFNDSLIAQAPSAPIPFPVHFLLFIFIFLYFELLSLSTQLKSSVVQGATGITLSISFHSSSVIIIKICYSFISLSFTVSQTPYFHLSTSSSTLSFPFPNKNLSNFISTFT